MVTRPFPALGIGWIFALIVLVVWVLALFGVPLDNAKTVAASFILLALAILL